MPTYVISFISGYAEISTIKNESED